MANLDKNIEEKSSPVNQLTVRGCHVAIWENMSSQGNEYKQFTVSRIYSESGTFKNGHSFSISDIPNLVIALQEMYRAEVVKN